VLIIAIPAALLLDAPSANKRKLDRSETIGAGEDDLLPGKARACPDAQVQSQSTSTSAAIRP
jgi:hypothetical protein